MRGPRRLFVVAGGVAIVVAACNLNPQPLPPLEGPNAAGGDSYADAGFTAVEDDRSKADASVGPPATAGDAGDGGTASDASDGGTLDGGDASDAQ